MEEYRCPKCEESSIAEHWDSFTKKTEGIEETSPYMSVTASPKDHQTNESYFHCPMCGEEVDGVDIVVAP